MRGTMSIATTVAPRALTVSSSSGFCAGQKNEISVCPVAQRLGLGHLGPAHLDQHIRRRDHGRRVWQHLDPGLGIQRIRKPGLRPAPA